MAGLEGELWDQIVADIQELSLKGCYEPVSDAISFYLARKLRVLAAALLGAGRDDPGLTLLDAGCGPGTSTRVVRALYPSARLIAMDPGPLNIIRASASAGGGTSGVQGMFESIPVASRSLDGVVAMFSFRDAANYLRALDEFSRVLKDDGRLVVLDLYRPEGPELALSLLQFRFIGPAIGLAMGCGPQGLKFGDIYRTVLSMLTPSQLVSEAAKRFRKVAFKPMPFLVGILYAEGPRRGVKG